MLDPRLFCKNARAASGRGPRRERWFEPGQPVPYLPPLREVQHSFRASCTEQTELRRSPSQNVGLGPRPLAVWCSRYELAVAILHFLPLQKS
jgi:hypothetical protein